MEASVDEITFLSLLLHARYLKFKLVLWIYLWRYYSGLSQKQTDVSFSDDMYLEHMVFKTAIPNFKRKAMVITHLLRCSAVRSSTYPHLSVAPLFYNKGFPKFPKSYNLFSTDIRVMLHETLHLLLWLSGKHLYCIQKVLGSMSSISV